MKKYIILLFSVGLLSCNSGNNEMAKRDEAIKKISLLETELGKNIEHMDNDQTKKTIALYKDFLHNFPKDAKCKEYAFKIAQAEHFSGNFQVAIRQYNDVFKAYPLSDQAPLALAAIAFIYENNLDSKGQARDYYNKLLTEYPKHNLAADAKIMIDKLDRGESDLEFLKRITGKNDTLAQ